MKQLRSLSIALGAFMLLSAFAPGCLSSTTSTGQPGPDWPKLIECGPDVNDIVSTVSRILFSVEGQQCAETRLEECRLGDAALAELEQLAAEHTKPTVMCVVDRLVTDMQRPGAAQTPDRMKAAARGRHFLDGVDVRRVGYGPEARWLKLHDEGLEYDVGDATVLVGLVLQDWRTSDGWGMAL